MRPVAPVSPAARAGARRYGDPVAYPDDLLAAGEQVVVHTRPHWKTLVWPVLAFLVTVGLAAYLAAVIGGQTWTGWGRLGLGLLAAALVGWLTVVPVARWRTTHLVVTDRRVLVREGIVARQGIDMPMSRIDSVRYSHSMLEGLLGCGTLTIDSASGEPLEVEDVPHVQRVHALLYTEAEPTGDD
ncbi:MAG: PH domain-containing protein [Pseudonocardia sp.]